MESPKTTTEKLNMSLVSVIINCFNGEKFIKEAMDSVLAQSYSSLEVVFWDNHSTDGSRRVVESYSDSRIRYFYAQEHTTLYEARTLAARECRGEFLAFLDVDDKWELHKLDCQIPYFEDPKVGLVFGNYWISGKSKGLKLRRQRRGFRDAPEALSTGDLLSNYIVCLSTLVIKREAFMSLEPKFDSRYNIIGDFDLAIRLSLDWETRCISQPLATYTIHESNLSRRRLLRVSEMENWLSEVGKCHTLANFLEIKTIEITNLYLKIICYLLSKERTKAFHIWKELPFGPLKIRALLALVIPYSMLRRLTD